MLDVACGTGIVARLAAERVGPGCVTGVDVNPGMLAVARSVAAAIEWRQADGQATALPDAAYDVALCQLGLQFCADRPAALRELRRVLRPGGRLVVNVPGAAPPVFRTLEEALRAHVSAEAAGFVSVVFSLNDPDELRKLIGDAGFSDVAVDVRTRSLRLAPPLEFLRQYLSSTPLAAAVADHQRAALEREVAGRWDAFTDGGGLRLELEVITATARTG